MAPTVYLTDLLIFIFVALTRTKVKTYYLILFLLFAGVNIYFSISPWASFWKLLKILELIFFAKCVFDNRGIIKNKIFVKTFSISLIIISLVGVTQFFIGRTLGTPFGLLGERTFGIETPGIALQTIFGREHLRAYSIFSHPNSFAGYLFVSIVFLLTTNYFRKEKKLFWLTILFSTTAFLLTFSLSAFIGAFVVLVFWLLFKNKKNYLKLFFGIVLLLSFILPFVKYNSSAPQEVRERIELANVSKSVISKNFLTGSGLNTFVHFNRLMQPVHNIFLLTLSETGIIGFGVLVFLFYFGLKKNPLIFIFILVTGFFDHYWLTLQQNLLLLTLLLGAVLN